MFYSWRLLLLITTQWAVAKFHVVLTHALSSLPCPASQRFVLYLFSHGPVFYIFTMPSVRNVGESQALYFFDCNVTGTRPQSSRSLFAISAIRWLSMFMALGMLLARLVVLFCWNHHSHCVAFFSQFAMHDFLEGIKQYLGLHFWVTSSFTDFFCSCDLVPACEQWLVQVCHVVVWLLSVTEHSFKSVPFQHALRY